MPELKLIHEVYSGEALDQHACQIDRRRSAAHPCLEQSPEEAAPNPFPVRVRMVAPSSSQKQLAYRLAGILVVLIGPISPDVRHR